MWRKKNENKFNLYQLYEICHRICWKLDLKLKNKSWPFLFRLSHAFFHAKQHSRRCRHGPKHQNWDESEKAKKDWFNWFNLSFPYIFFLLFRLTRLTHLVACNTKALYAVVNNRKAKKNQANFHAQKFLCHLLDKKKEKIQCKVESKKFQNYFTGAERMQKRNEKSYSRDFLPFIRSFVLFVSLFSVRK